MEFPTLPSDPTLCDLEAFATALEHGCCIFSDDDDGDAQAFALYGAAYWIASEHHTGQASNLYAVLSRSEYCPGPLETAESFAGADPAGGILLEAMRDALREARQSGGQA